MFRLVEHYRHLGYDSVQPDRMLPTFWRDVSNNPPDYTASHATRHVHENIKPHKIISCNQFTCTLKMVLISADNACCCACFDNGSHGINVCNVQLYRKYLLIPVYTYLITEEVNL
jgi:hypothetical protein